MYRIYFAFLAVSILSLTAANPTVGLAQDSKDADQSKVRSEFSGNTAAGASSQQSAAGGLPERRATPNASPVRPPAAAPVSITIDASGKLIIKSDDPAALDRLEKIMRSNRPPQRPYDVFEVKYARATWIKLNLVEYFEENDGDNDWQRVFFGFDFDDNEDKDRELGSRPPLRFIADNDTNSIVVIGADDFDRQTIKDLIKLWDVPEPDDDVDNDRYTELVPVKYSRADSIAATLKEAYRDLLSANDKAFQGGEEESKRDSGGSDGGFSLSFKGKLSLGVDNVTNSILVSAEGENLLNIMMEMIKKLDEAAKTESEIAVARVPVSMNNDSVREALLKMFASQKPDKNKQAQQQQQQQEAQQQQQQQQQQLENAQRGRSSRSRRR